MSNPTEFTAAQLAGAIRERQISSAEATDAYLAAIAMREPQLHAYTEVLADHACKQAAEVDRRLAAGEEVGPLAGVPVALKDNLCTPFGRTTCASKMLGEFHAPYMSSAVARLMAAGAVVLGKANMDEFAMGSSTENSALGATRNPWDNSRVPGGSSGGSAAAVAARTCAGALGSDTGGSIRQPAAFCGVVGFKPTYGRVSRYGLVAYGSSLDQIGPLARDVRDAALLTGVIAGYDPLDSTSLDKPVDDYLAKLDERPQKLRVGLVREFFSEALDGEVAQAVRDAAGVLEKNGAELVDVSLPHSRIDRDADGRFSSYAVAAYYIVAMAEASSNLARYDGVHYGHRTSEEIDDIVELYSRSRSEALGSEVKRRIMLGTYTLSAGYYDAYYNKALKVRRLIKNDFDAAFERCDVLLCPTAPTTAFAIGSRTDDPLTMYLEDIYTISVNLAGLPGLNLPAGLSATGLPIGMQLIGPVLSESLLFRTGHMYQQLSGVCDLRPPLG
jgi:aspartyl-tRNA(Asn)/glutamyl-tRNA(Gln) amidotransferase subunit A